MRIDFSIRFTRVRSKSLISKKIDRPQPVPSNQLDRPQAFRLEAITHNSMFADYLHRRIPPTKFATKLSKIAASFSTRQNPTFVINLTKIGPTLSPEEHRLHAWGRSASRGTHKIMHPCPKSTGKSQIFLQSQTVQALMHALIRARTKDIVSDLLEISSHEASNCTSSPRNVRSGFCSR